jgi:subtilisin family serine protease
MAGIFVGAIDCAADVLNLSLGFKAIRKCGVCGASGAVRSFALETAMGIAQQARSGGGQQGFLYVAAAGNDGLSTGLDHPARYACVVPVGSVDSAGNRSDFSNFDRANLHANHIMAPGGQISGSAVTEDVGRWQSTQRQCHGTSGATAYASAMLALLWSDSRYVALDSKAFLAVVKTSHCTLQLGQRTDEHGSGLIHYNPPLLAAGRRADDSASPTSIEYVADGVYVGDVFLSGSQ